jgi:hypothetical protein
MVDDPVEAEFIGIINYCVIALIQSKLGETHTGSNLPIAELETLYDEAVESTLALLLRKNHDYSEAWRDMRVSSITDIILMKLHRLKQIENNQGRTEVSEGVEANYQDMLNYSVFALIIGRENGRFD